MGNTNLLDTVSKILMNLSTNEGINASGKDESFGCIFGRDSAITILKILKAYSNKSSYTVTEMSNLMAVCRRALLTLVELQGKRKNRESGEEPGKFIHEYRKEKFERLTKRFNPWYIYPDGILRNYDSIDSTPLGLIAIYKYWDMTKDGDFLIKALPAVEKGLNWIITYGDIDKDILIEYEFHKNRKFGGLLVQSWTDSRESIKDKNGIMPSYPIAPVEAQGYAWLALKLWGDFYSDKKLVFNKNEIKGKLSATENFGRKLLKQADLIKEKFNKSFIFKDNEFNFAAQALNGDKNQITTITGNPLLLLWASRKTNIGVESIIDDSYINDLVERSFKEDLFDKDAGIRTMSKKSLTYNPNENSYHNGSFWPKLNGMIHEGLEVWGYAEKAKILKEATLKPISFFNTPIELYIKDSDNCYKEYKNSRGQVGCRHQAWSAAVVLDLLTL